MSLAWTTTAQDAHEGAELITRSDARVSERLPMRFWAKLSGEMGAGNCGTAWGHVLNMSASGVLLEALTPIAIGSQVRIQADELLAGTAYVRHSTRCSWKFRIGLEFAAVLHNGR